MNARMVRATLAISSVLVASIVVGGMLVFVGGLLYRWLAEVASPAVAIPSIIASALVVGALVMLLGQYALRRAVPTFHKGATAAPAGDDLIAEVLVRLANGSPTKLVAASLGVGFVLGFSPRLRRVVYRAFID